MTAIMVKLLLALSLVLITSALCSRHNAAAYTPADNYLIDCGSDVDTPVGRRVFVSDDGSGPVTLTTHHSAAVKASPGSVPADFDGAAVYLTARVFTVSSSYSFTISRQGPHFVRLHVFPFASDGYDLAAARFKVSTQDAVLVDSFTPARNNASCDEFLLRVDRDTLVVTFVPLAGHVAFVNAVEVISVPDDLFTGRAVEAVGQALGQRVNPASVLPLQMAFRVNVGGPAVAADGDALWREWATDQRFLTGSVGTREVAFNRSRLNRLAGEATIDDAPDAVYATARQMDGSNWVDTSKQMMWQFDVVGGQQPSSSPSYLVRLHFCDIVSTAPHLLLIDVYLNNYAAVTGLDLSTIGSGVLAFPYFMDFVLDSSDQAGRISVTIGSSSTMKKNSTLPGPILNGIEIMRMNFSSGSAVVVDPATRSKKRQVVILVGSLCGAFAVVSVAAVLVIVFHRRKKKVKPTVVATPSSQSSPPSTPWMPLLNRFSFSSGRQSTSRTGSSPSSFTVPGSSNTQGSSSHIRAAAQSSVPSYRVPFATLQAATNNFDESLLIGAGGFGTVYRAVLPDGTTIAAKRASPESRQGAREFRNEIETLSGLRHRHLVSLVGYCDEADEMVLIYEYMAQGSLRSRLHELSWAQRLDALVGAAQGLLYLHTALDQPVIHRDVKSSNILLDAGGAAKVADFGLSRAGPGPEESHVSTAVKGSFGYVDPEYARTRRLTPKSDVYSFGVVMLEALCGRPVVNPRMVNLVEWWGLHWRRNGGEVDKVVVDRRVAAEVRPAALRKYGETVARCLAERGADRPAMEDVLWSLKFVVRLQDDGNALEFSDVDSFVVNGLTPLPSESDPPRPRSSPGSENGGEEEEDDLADGNYTDVSMGGIFRQMINVRGR